MSSPELHPANYSEFNSGDGLIQDRFPIIRKEMLEGSAENPNNITIFVGPTEEKFIVNKYLAMLSSHLLEKSIVQASEASEQNEMIKFPELLPTDFQLILECAILGKNWTFTSSQEACHLIEIAGRFGFNDFIETICETVFREALRTNVLDDKENIEKIVFHSFKFKSLRDKAVEYILENASSIFEGNKFLELSVEDLEWVLIQDKLKVESEIEVLNALIRWGMNVLQNENKPSSPESLMNVLAEPLHSIRFPNMKECEFRDYVIPLKILTDRQVKAMELWYKNGGAISAFFDHPRDYSKPMNSKVAAHDPESTKNCLHVTKLVNMLAKFNTNIKIHNMEIQARELINKTAELESENQQLKSQLVKWQKINEANRFCQKLESLTNYYESRTTNTTCEQKNKRDFDLLKLAADKIRKCEDFSELLANFRPEGIDLQLLESDVETVEKNILQWLRVKRGDIYEHLSWKIFQKETASTVLDLQKFENTQKYACAIIFKNNTSETLGNFQLKHHDDDQVYITLPENIQPFYTHNFGQMCDWQSIYGVLSYDFGSTRIVVRQYFQESNNDFGIAITPLTLSMDDWEGFNVFEDEDWTNDSTKVKALCKAPQEMEKCIQLGNLFLHAELIGTGRKAVLRVLLTAL